MPGNEVKDRVHNFFAQDSMSQEHHSPVVDGNLPALSNSLGIGSQRQTGGLSSNAYNLQISDTTRGHSSYPFNGQRGLDSAQSTQWAEFARGQQPNSNGIMYGNQYYQTRQDESSFLAVNTGSNQCNLASGGSFFHELQRGAGHEQQARGLVRSEPSGSPVSLDLFGGQQMNGQQSNMLQSLQRQQSRLNEMQQLQQQAMFMKMQELQRQQQLDAGPQNLLNQVPPVPKVASSNHSPASINGTNYSGAVNFALATELGNTNWLQHGSPVLQGSANGFNPTNYEQAQHLMGLIPQNIDQSLYGIPVANSRGSLSQLPLVGTKKPTVQPMPTFTGSFPVNECAELSGQVSGQDGTSIHRVSLLGESFFGHTGSQALSNAVNTENLQQANNVQKGSALQDFCSRLDVTSHAETSQEKVATQASSPRDEVGLDPTEERILFGSDSSIWGSFSKSPNRNEEGVNLFDSAGLLTGSPSIQGGTWSALMQSAVAETSSSDIGLQEECSGLNFHSAEIPSGNQNLMYNSGRHKSSSADKLPLAPSLNSFSVRPSDSIIMNNSFHNVQGHRFPYEQGQNLQANSQRPVDSSHGGSKWSDFGPLQTSVAESSQIFSNTSHPLDTEMISRRGSRSLTPELGGARQPWMKSASWGVLGSAVPSGDAAFSILSENSSKRLQDNNQKKYIQEKVFHGGVTLKSSSRSNSAVDMEHAGSSMASPRGYSEVFSSYHSATAPNSSTMRCSSPCVDGKEFTVHEMENSDKKDNSNDSSHSNLHPHSFTGGVRENALSDASDSRCHLMGKQKLSDQGGRKNSWPPKFQYHPLGNLDEDADPSRSMEQSTHSQSIMQHNPQHGQSKVFGQVPHSLAELEKGQLSDVLMDDKGSSEVHCQSRFPGGGSNIPGPFNRSRDLHSPNKAAESSPNMLQLIQKVDQSREYGSMSELGHSEKKASSKMPEAAEDSDESVGHHLRSQSGSSQGYGLQLGPPSRRASVRNHSLTSQRPIQAFSSSHSSHAAVDAGEKNQGPMHPPHQAQSLLSPSDPSQEGLKNIGFGIAGSTNNVTSMYAMPGNLSPPFDSHSGFPHRGGQLKIPNVARTTAQLPTNQSLSVSFDKHTSSHTEKGDSCRGSANGQSVEASLMAGVEKLQDKPILSAGKSQLSNTNRTVESIFTNQVASQEPVSVSQALVSGIGQQGTYSKMSSGMWGTFPPPQQLFGSQYGKDPSHISQSHQLNIVESSFSAPGRQSDQYLNRGNFASQIGTSSVNSLVSSEGEEQRAKESHSQQISVRNVDHIQKNDSQGREPFIKYILGGSPANAASMQRDIEAFGRTLKPNLSNQNYSLLNQVQAIKHVEVDPTNRDFKRMKVADSSTGAPQVSSGDTEMLGFSVPEDLQRSISSQQGRKMSPHDVLALHQVDSQSSSHSNNTNSVTLEQTQNGSQLEPSWFSQCRTLKNGQMLHMYDARRAAAMKTVEQPLTIGKSSSSLHALNSMLQIVPATSDRSTIGNIEPNSVPSSAAIDHFSSPTLPVNVDHQHLISKPMKRKRATSENTPWHKEVLVDSRSSQTISLAEREWARAANRLTEKVKEGIDFNEEGAPGVKAKRRAILTTQLMQQLLPSPPAAILSADANSEYESVGYSISRLALGDACSMLSCSKDDRNMPCDDKELLPEECITSKRINKHDFAKTLEELQGRARRLESDFMRLDKRASVLDVTVDGQDQEKFGVINRYARFLGRGQYDGIPQRYVTALPIPKDLPSGVHCLSLLPQMN